jgi:hypothetical protein
LSGSGTSSLAGLLNLYIRRFNYLLLEICKPEALILRAAQLPRAYVREYVERQDHFSAVAVIRSYVQRQCAALDAVSGGVDDGVSLLDLILYTRTTHDIATLAHHAELQAALKPEPGMRVWVLPLALYGTGSDMEAALHGACSAAVARARHGASAGSRRSLIVVLVDLAPSAATETQYHFALDVSRRIVSSVDCEYRPVLVFVVHFPPELAQFDARTTSVPTGNWRYVYVDSLGFANAAVFQSTDGLVLSDAADVITEGVSESKGDDADDTTAGVAEHVHTVEEIADPRRWLAVAVGLRKAPSDAALQAEFGACVRADIGAVAAMARVQVVMKATEATRKGLKNTAVMYTKSVTPERAAVIVDVFESRPYLLQELVTTFREAWTECLHPLVKECCEGIARGSLSHGLLDATRERFQVTP